MVSWLRSGPFSASFERNNAEVVAAPFFFFSGEKFFFLLFSSAVFSSFVHHDSVFSHSDGLALGHSTRLAVLALLRRKHVALLVVITHKSSSFLHVSTEKALKQTNQFRLYTPIYVYKVMRL